jgi:Rrf2 family protein
MKLSKKCEYAISALSNLALKMDRGPVLIKTISDQEKIPKKFLESILYELKKRGIVISIRGSGGGYRLNRDPREISLAEVIRNIDGSLAPTLCVSEAAYSFCPLDKERSCKIKPVMSRIRESIAEILENISIHEINEKKPVQPTRKRRKKVIDYSGLSMNMD